MMHCNEFLFLQCKSFIDTSFVFCVGTNIGFVIPKGVFGKDKFNGGIKLNPKFNLEVLDNLQFFITDGSEDI